MGEVFFMMFSILCGAIAILCTGMAVLLAFEWCQRRIERYKTLNRWSHGLGKKRGGK